MNILDENIPTNQRRLLEINGAHIRQIGLNVGRSGMQDEEIVPLLLRQRRPTFFTRDDDFYDRRLCRSKYCLVYLDVDKNEVALFVRSLPAPSGSSHAGQTDGYRGSRLTRGVVDEERCMVLREDRRKPRAQREVRYDDRESS